MKKSKFILLIVFSFFITGCASDIKCTNSYDELIKYDIEVTADLKDGDIINATARMKFENSKDATTMCNLEKMIDNAEVVCKETEIVINNYQKLMLTDNEKTISKNEFIKKLEKDKFKC